MPAMKEVHINPVLSHTWVKDSDFQTVCDHCGKHKADDGVPLFCKEQPSSEQLWSPAQARRE